MTWVLFFFMSMENFMKFIRTLRKWKKIYGLVELWNERSNNIFKKGKLRQSPASAQALCKNLTSKHTFFQLGLPPLPGGGTEWCLLVEKSKFDGCISDLKLPTLVTISLASVWRRRERRLLTDGRQFPAGHTYITVACRTTQNIPMSACFLRQRGGKTHQVVPKWCWAQSQRLSTSRPFKSGSFVAHNANKCALPLHWPHRSRSTEPNFIPRTKPNLMKITLWR